ncbi:hypothetical protein [Virgibacillus sp. MG-45]|uniref:hypothetical protein n=1 Tax=Virgibacillus sp. MG-45 TaxID=3102791 RepID=UPI002ED89097
MFKRKPLLIVALISFIFFSYGCSQQTEGVILSKDSNSEYVKTFNDLSLGTILDFNIQIPNEDERWFTLWVEKYENGQKISKPLSELSFPNNPNEEVD